MSARNVWRAIMAVAAAYAVAAMVVIVVAIVTAPSSSAEHGAFEAAMAGGRRNGRPARGELYTDEERDYRDAHPAPVWRDFLARQNASSAAAA